jgi:hypothetical protein
MFKAILSTTILPVDGDYTVFTLTDEQIEKLDLTLIRCYIGHPSTKVLMEQMGAIYTMGLFSGLEQGERALCVSIKQGMSSRGEIGKTVDQEITKDMLSFRVVERMDRCLFCGGSIGQNCCGSCGAT